jgi:chemotaxis protein MotB
MSAKSNAPVIIKRKKLVSGGGHHGGAWKVAYADFVTAMMAFFMLMWLLNATTEKQRKGIADYFSPTIPINRISGGGEGSFGGDSVFSEETLAQNGIGASQKRPTEAMAAKGSTGVDAVKDGGRAEAAAFAEVERALTAMSGESMVANQALRHINTRLTDEGLIVEIFDIDDEMLFEDGSTEPTELLNEIVKIFEKVFAPVQNQLAISGFVRSYPVVIAQSPVWNLSSERADIVRILLEQEGMPSKRIERVTGYADNRPAAANPMSNRNNRLEITLLRDPA